MNLHHYIVTTDTSDRAGGRWYETYLTADFFVGTRGVLRLWRVLPGANGRGLLAVMIDSAFVMRFCFVARARFLL